MKKENAFQAQVIREIKEMFPGCVILKNDPGYLQGFPDLSIFYGRHWAVLETKRSEHEPHRPNQDYYVDYMDEMSYASFIFPENKEKVYHELQQALAT